MTKPAPDRDQGDEALTVGPAPSEAAGPKAVAVSARHVRDQLGVVRGARTLLALNQPDGFDCPGCAWPDPGHTSTFEFCENGVKAVAEEATTRRIEAGFWVDHPISDLVLRSDHWLGQQGRLTEPVHRAAGADHVRHLRRHLLRAALA